MKMTLAVLFLFFSISGLQAQDTELTNWATTGQPAVEAPQEARQELARPVFYAQVLRAIPAAVRDGTLSRRDALRLRFAMISPAFRSQCRQLAKIQVLSSGEQIPTSMTNSEIDWSGDIWSEFFKLLLPILLELLEQILQGLGGGP